MTTPMFDTLVAREPDATRPDMTAQRLELIGRFAAYHVANTFAPGDLVAEKPGLSLFKREFQENHAFLFWAWLDREDPFDRQLIEKAVEQGYTAVDCLLACTADEPGGIILSPRDSRMLRHLAHEERAALDHVLAQDGVAA